MAPGSKAYTHRALVASLLTRGETRINHPLECDDTRKTLEGIKALGANVTVEDDRIISHGFQKVEPSPRQIDCGESGATLRFLTAVASVYPTSTRFHAGGILRSRPLDPLLKALEDLGATTELIQLGRRLELTITGPLKGGETALPGDISSQFVSGLLLAAPYAQTDVHIRLTSTLESRLYVDMTIEVLRKHGVIVDATDREFRIPAPQEYQPASHEVEGDFSSAAFLIAAAAYCGESIGIVGLSENSLEPDSAILDIAPELGLRLHRKHEILVVEQSKVKGFQFDASNNPDLVPALEVLGCIANGNSQISGLHRLRFKESNRLLTVPVELSKMGGKIQITDDRVKIEPGEGLSGARMESYQDHRVAMACSVAAIGAHGESVIEHAEAVSKSYPNFFDDLRSLGAEIHVE